MDKKIILFGGDPNSINSEIIFKSWKVLNNKGVLICDDYFYGDIYKNPNNVPSIAINKFIKEESKNNSIKILCVNNSQIFLRKIN